MHSVLSTAGLIIEERSFGEADKILLIMTESFGLVKVKAIGIRHLKSKLRYHTQIYSHGYFSLVRGKEYWRLVSAEPNDLSTKIVQKPVILRVTQLLKRLLQGEDAAPEIFTILSDLTMLLETNWSEKHLQVIETIVVYKILSILGYLPIKAEIDQGCVGDITGELLDKYELKKKIFNKEINFALKNSQL